MNTQKTKNDADQNGGVRSAAGSKLGLARGITRASTRKSGAKSKQDQLIVLLSKPNGARISVIVERLGWRAHTVRAAVSGLRKRGFKIATSKSAKTGEIVYAIKARPVEKAAALTGASS
jgi:predicted DNA-binding transcriptional regulator